MINIQQASEIIAAALTEPGVETIAIERAHGRCLAEPVSADRDQPPFDRATMDGIALSSAAVRAGTVAFRVAGVQAAGQPTAVLPDGQQCFEIMTGAVLPEGCDCVVPVEEIELTAERAALNEPALCRPWRFVHRRGTDYPAGHDLLPVGQLLGAPELAVLAAVGRSEVAVRKLPRVCVVSTGDELVEPGQPVAAHQIRMSNDYAILGRLRGRGLGELSRLHLRDNPDLLRQSLAPALADHDLLILSGGVSRGKFDFLPQVLSELGVEQRFHRVAQKPGKPLWFGMGNGGQGVFALPGNPVSALVCFARYVLPALDQLNGQGTVNREVTLAETMSFDNDLARLVPVTLDGDKAWPRELNTSGDFFGLAGTAGFCQLDAQPRVWKAGAPVRFFPW